MLAYMPLITTKQAADELGVTDQRVRQLLAQHRIVGAEKPGRDWMIPAPIQVLTARQAAMAWISAV